MAELNFPPANETPFVDPSGITWDHDGDGWAIRGDGTTAEISMLVQELPPDPTGLTAGQEWLRTSDMVKFTLYEDADSKQWVQELNGAIGLPGPSGIDTPTGFKNVLINGAFKVNQHKVPNIDLTFYDFFAGDWTALAIGAYGYDCWFKISDTYIAQYVEAENVKPNTAYTLSWEGGGSEEAEMNILDVNIVTGVSPLQVTSGSLSSDYDTRIKVPSTAYNIQLELGTQATAFELRNYQIELGMCRRFFKEYVRKSGNIIISQGAYYDNVAKCEFFMPFDPPMRSGANLSVEISDFAHFIINQGDFDPIEGISLSFGGPDGVLMNLITYGNIPPSTRPVQLVVAAAGASVSISGEL